MLPSSSRCHHQAVQYCEVTHTPLVKAWADVALATGVPVGKSQRQHGVWQPRFYSLQNMPSK